MRKLLGLFAMVCLVAAPLAAQDTGAISGRVASPDGDALMGVTVTATSSVLPQAMTVTSGADGAFRFPFLPPGEYQLVFSMQAMADQTRTVRVRLDTTTTVNVAMAPEAIEAAIDVVETSPMLDPSTAEIKTAIGNEEIEALPVGQEYRDLQKLIPGVTYTEDSSRGPSDGGSGQDNVYLFDGVSVNLPLFGVLSAEPSSHDIEEVSIIRGGAKALDFNRSSGLTINSISKSGTNLFHGEVSYQIQTDSMTSDQKNQVSQIEQDQDWLTASIGGPIARDLLHFYASYYRPTVTQNSKTNVYGKVPGLDSVRDEYFGRLSFQPTNNVLIHGSYRDSDRDVDNASVGAFEAASVSQGDQATLKITTLEGTWSINERSYATFKYTDFENKTGSFPDNRFGFSPAGDGSVPLNVGALETQGYFEVPSLIPGNDAYNQFIQQYIDRYGYLENGVRVGGGAVGGDDEINIQDFYRESYQLGYDLLFGENVTHELHFGYQWYRDEEDLDRLSNGWGVISAPENLVSPNGTPAAFLAEVWQSGVINLPGGDVGVIHSEFESQNFEVNDTIRWGDWTFNVGLLMSNDELFGQGLRENKNNLSGFELCSTCKYKMYEVDWEDQIQPRLGAIWAYAPEGTVYANFARYNPAANSLPRAASWARNNRQILEAYFDAAGNLIEIEGRASSSGKFFQPDMDPRATDEYLIGTSRQLTPRLTGRLTARHRRSYNFWEDTNNNARQFGNAPANISNELYIPELNDYRFGPNGVGGSSYVIAELDNAFTKYYEVAGEVEWRPRNAFVRGSYVWSHYYGNFDQDNTASSGDDDTATFIGSSNIADGPGRQIWDNKYGNLGGDRRHKLKVFGYYQLKWDATVGAFAIYQSGAPWQAWNVEYYRAFTGSSSDVIRYSEPAGSRKTPAHYQLDLNYTHNFKIGDRYDLQLIADLFNVFDKQTGYRPIPNERAANFGAYQDYYRPRRFQLSARFRF